MAAIKIWEHKLTGTYFWVLVDNEAVATILNTGASRDKFLQQVLREILMTAAKGQFMIKAKHIKGVDNRIPDWLSRWHEPEARKNFRRFSREKSLKRIRVSQQLLITANL